MAYANEGAEKAKQEEELANRKRKVEEHAKWEGELYYPFITTGSLDASGESYGSAQGSRRTRRPSLSLRIPPSGRRRC